jgi:predicted ATP-binding protein involved in virulence
MYAVNTLSQQPVGELCNTPGLLLIDEVENHLHPRWQKWLIPAILDVFPNLQIVATTHSPFVLTSWPEARVHVCRYDAARQVCTVTEETSAYAHKPVDEILLSGAFDETQPFGVEITELLAARKAALRAGDEAARETIAQRLLALNPTYFSYLEVHKRLAALPGAPA